VVGVAGGDAAAHAGEAHRLELQEGLGGGEVLGQDLVDPDADLLAGDHPPLHEVGPQDLARQVLAHRCPSVRWDYWVGSMSLSVLKYRL